MGWSSQSREKGISNLDWFADLLDSSTGHVVDAATVGGTCYIAYHVHEPGENEYITALVIPTCWSPRETYNFSYKIIDECMGPGDQQCPERILRQLSPVEEITQDPSSMRWMSEWREACWRRHRARRQRGPVSKNAQVLFRDPILFTDGTSAERFQWLGGSIFYRMYFQGGEWQQGSKVRIRNWRDLEWAKLDV